MDVFTEDASGKRLTTPLAPWECISRPAGVIHGYQNDTLEPGLRAGDAWSPETMSHTTTSSTSAATRMSLPARKIPILASSHG
jgi:hypothetical protein